MKKEDVQLHPASITALKRGHPWVTTDSYSVRFPRNSLFLGVMGHKGLTLLHDPEHDKVKARLWSMSECDDFYKTLGERISAAILKRVEKKIPLERENLYLVFGEGDQLPGLFIQKLGHVLFIQYYAFVWKKFEKEILQSLNSALNTLMPEWTEGLILVQERKGGGDLKRATSPTPFQNELLDQKFSTIEFGIKYKLFFEKHQDVGIYTDMSGCRKKIGPLFKKDEEVLNLFSYTGAYSLFGLKAEAKVTSVDLSPHYLKILDENIELNPTLNKEGHRSLAMSTVEALLLLQKEKRLFHLIICDPPSFSSDGKVSTPAFKSYPKLIELMKPLVAPLGHLVMFLNTHEINKDKFANMVKQNLGPKWKEGKPLSLCEDCPTLPSFPEGNYLKGMCFKKLE